MKQTIADLNKQLHLCVYGETMRDRSKAYERLNSMMVSLNCNIGKRLYHCHNLIAAEDYQKFLIGYGEFTYYFNELSKMPLETNEYYEESLKCKNLLDSLDAMFIQ